jgi:hypothetical protein
VWEAATGKLVANLPYPDVADCFGFSPDSRWLYVGGKQDRRLNVASLAATQPQAAPSVTTGPPTWQGEWKSESVKLEGAFSPDHELRAVGTDDGAISLAWRETDREIARFPTPEVGALGSPAFSSDGAVLLARGGETGALYVFDLRRIREQLAELGLDWDDVQPALPPQTADDDPVRAPRLQVQLIDAAQATSHKK